MLASLDRGVQLQKKEFSAKLNIPKNIASMKTINTSLVNLMKLKLEMGKKILYIYKQRFIQHSPFLSDIARTWKMLALQCLRLVKTTH